MLESMCSPVTLTVARETLLNLDVDVGESSFERVISGHLMSSGEPVIGREVKIYVNDSLEAEVSTQEVYGDFSLTFNLPSVNNKPTVYNVQAVFEGDNPQNATTYAYTPNGTRYAGCSMSGM